MNDQVNIQTGSALEKNVAVSTNPIEVNATQQSYGSNQGWKLVQINT